MFQVTFMIGLTIEPSNLAVESLHARMGRASRLLMEKFGGYTGYGAAGGWKDPDGKEIIEPALVLVVLTNDVARGYVGEVAGKLRDMFNQQCVAVSVVDATVMYV